MKKIIAVLMALIMIMSMSACGANNPQQVTENFLTAVKEQDKDALQVYLENPHINILANNEGSEKEIKTIFNSLTKNLSWEIVSEKVNEKKTKATVKVKISNSDFSGVLGTYQTEAVKYTTDNLTSAEFTKEVMTENCIRIFAQHVKAAAVEDTISEQTVTVKLVKDEKNRWCLELSDELINAILGGLQFPL